LTPTFRRASAGRPRTPARTRFPALAASSAFDSPSNARNGRKGNKVIGKAFQPPAGSTELTDSNGIVRLTGNFTSVKFTLTPTPGSTIPSDGVFLQIGGTTTQSLATSKSADEMATV
jgi:hypothetical protein